MMETPEQFGIKDSERTRCEIWTRVMGYHRPISSFNIGKQGEAAERKYFSEKSAEMNSIVSCNGKTPPRLMLLRQTVLFA